MIKIKHSDDKKHVQSELFPEAITNWKEDRKSITEAKIEKISFDLKEACALKRICPKTAYNKIWKQPRCGYAENFNGRKKLWSRETINDWVYLTEEELYKRYEKNFYAPKKEPEMQGNPSRFSSVKVKLKVSQYVLDSSKFVLKRYSFAFSKSLTKVSIAWESSALDFSPVFRSCRTTFPLTTPESRSNCSPIPTSFLISSLRGFLTVPTFSSTTEDRSSFGISNAINYLLLKYYRSYGRIWSKLQPSAMQNCRREEMNGSGIVTYVNELKGGI